MSYPHGSAPLARFFTRLDSGKRGGLMIDALDSGTSDLVRLASHCITGEEVEIFLIASC